MKKQIFSFAVVVLGFVALWCQIHHLKQVIHDKQVYIDAGARGRYQGEEE
jgi:fumarate reductase subunit D